MVPGSLRDEVYRDLKWFQDEYKKGGQSQYYPHASIDNRTAIDTFIRYLGRKKYSHQLHIDSIRDYLKRLYVR